VGGATWCRGLPSKPKRLLPEAEKSALLSPARCRANRRAADPKARLANKQAIWVAMFRLMRPGILPSGGAPLTVSEGQTSTMRIGYLWPQKAKSTGSAPNCVRKRDQHWRPNDA